ncbi:MAG: hypothetical protein Q8904_10120 [Bacteroidota bacterium]|nr:hypothetical protein [Bacteroidota bacterium]
MKNLLLTCLLALAASVTASAQLATFVLDDFENGQVNFSTLLNVNPPATMDFTVVDNPVKAGINTSNKVMKCARFDASPDVNQIWAGFYATLKNPIPTGYHRIEIKYLRTNATSQLRIKCEGAISKEMNPVTSASKTNEWENMVFDIYSNGIKNITVFSIFPDYYQPVDPTAVTYIDDITVVYDPSVIPPPTPTLLTLFDNSADNRFYDTSWINQTAPSTVVAENWDPTATTPGDKFPVVTSPVKAGTNALKLDWKSMTGGDWMGMVASIGWKSFNLTTMTHLRFWINSPVDLAKTALPKVYLEAFSGTPNVTGKLQLGDYLTSDLMANTWTEVIIPLADLWAADPTFTAKDVIKDVFFSQNATDGVEHILYLDEFTFVTLATLFNNSADNRFYDTSWINQTAPSTVVTENWDPTATTPGDKFPVVTSPVKSAPNALKLQWKSVTAGDWMGMVAAIGWTVFDLTTATYLDFWVNTPVTLAKNVLPKIYLESASGTPNHSGKVDMGNYLTSDLAANTWTEVKIPLADIWDADATFTAKDFVHGVFFSQNATDNVEHTLYLDDFTFIKPFITGFTTPKAENKLNPYYINGEVIIPLYTGHVRIFDITGKTIVDGIASNGKIRATIKQGIYIVTTTLGNAKIAVR